MTHDEDDSRRQRALRAAQAVTLGIGMALAGGCGASHTGGDGSISDGSTDSSGDSSADARPDADASDCVSFPDTQECCESWGGFWDEASGSCAVPGPFVPPSMSA